MALPIFILLFCLNIFLFCLEMFTYPGILEARLKIPILYFTLLVCASALLLINPKSRLKFSKRNANILILLTILEIGIYQFLNSVEVAFYPNFIYNRLGFDFTLLKVLILPSIILLLVHWINSYLIIEQKTIKKSSGNNRYLRLKAIMTLLIFGVFIYHLTIDFGYNFTNRLVFMILNPNANYDQKISEQLSPQFYRYIQFIRENTPENASILLPPQQSPWYAFGNRGYMRYFLYPRVLVNGKIDTNEIPKDVQYSLVIKNTSTEKQPDWPPYEVKAQIIILLSSNGKTQISNLSGQTFSPNETLMPSPFALLKL